MAGIEIGKLIRLRGFATWVPSGMLCASACAAAWLGGTPRAMGKDAMVGFHAAYRIEDGKPAESGVANAVMGSYLGQLGLPDRAIIYLTSSAPTSMNWLTPRIADSLGIEVKVFDLDTAVTEPRASPNAVSLERRASDFINDLYRRLSGPNEAMISWAFNHYSLQTDYFGKARRRDDIIADLARWFERWPRRYYLPREQSVSVKCDQAANTCTVEGLLDFIAESFERDERSVGTATFSFTLAFAQDGGDPKIRVENGRTIHRQKERITGSSHDLAGPLSRAPDRLSTPP
jgi:hypothetical protein